MNATQRVRFPLFQILLLNVFSLVIRESVSVPITTTARRNDRRFPVSFSQEDSDEVSEVSSAENATIITAIPSSSFREDEELREILCPGSVAVGGHLRYDLHLGKCGEIDTTGHCGKNMIFIEDPKSSAYGYCECDFENHSSPLVYHFPSNACYPIYKQGYCKPGEWLVLSPAVKGPLCERNRCPQTKPRKSIRRNSKILYPDLWNIDSDNKSKTTGTSSQNSIEGEHLVPLNGTGACVQLDAHSKHCSPSEKVTIPLNDIFPRCMTPGKSFRRLSIVPNACPPGSYYSIIGYCQPTWDF